MKPRSRRSFLKASAAFGCGLGAAGLSSLSIAGAVVRSADEGLNIIGPRKGFSPQIGTLVSMLNWMRNAILQAAQGLTVTQLDYLHDAKANSNQITMYRSSGSRAGCPTHRNTKPANLDAYVED